MTKLNWDRVRRDRGLRREGSRVVPLEACSCIRTRAVIESTAC